MKQLKINMFLFTVLALFTNEVVAQSGDVQETQTATDSSLIVIQSNKDKVIHTAFGETQVRDLLGGVSYINVDELMQKNNMNAYGINIEALTPGLNGNIWGSNGLTLVDGLPRDLGNVMPSEIEEITFLKGAQAVALYGSQAAKGILLVTTKRGRKNEKSFRVWASSGLYVPIRYPNYLGSAEYMTYYNEARANDGISAQYDDEMIYYSALGNNKYRYPNVDYYSSDYLRKFSNRTDVATEFRGGGEWARFYANMGFYKTNSLLKVGQGDNESIQRFHVRGNVDLKLSDYITGRINTSMAFYNTAFGKGDYWGAASSLRPNWYTPLIPVSYIEGNDIPNTETVGASQFLIDGQYLLGGRQDQLSTPFAALYTQGLEKYTARQYQFDAQLNFDLSWLTEGLDFEAHYGVDYYSRYTLSEDINEYAIYVAEWNNYSGEDRISNLTKYNQDRVGRGRNLEGDYEYQKAFFSGVFTYEKQLGQVHNISSKLLATGYQQSISGTYHKVSNANIGLQAAYNYDHRYYFDFTGAVVHSAKLPEGNRTAVSPTVSLGWRLSEEEFMSGVDFLNNLKLTASAGRLNLDTDISNFYLYSEAYRRPGAYQGYDFRWNENFFIQAIEIERIQNENIGFIKRKEFNAGLEADMFENKLHLTAGYYRIEMDGFLSRRLGDYPSYYSYENTGFTPFSNYEANLYKGFELGVSLKETIGQVGLEVGIVGSYTTNEATKRSENFDFDYQSRIGKSIDGIWGLVADGIFMNQEEVDNAPEQQFGPVKAGDIKYVDQNNDGRIDDNDQILLDRSRSPYLGGLNITTTYKNFSLFMLFRAQFGGKGMLGGNYYHVNANDKYSEVVRNRTQIALDANEEWYVTQLGSYPALTTSNGSNNFRGSTYWLYSTNRIDLSQIQLTYKVPQKALESIFIDDLDFYFNGSNWFTIAKEREILTTTIGSSPQSRFFSLGLKANF